MSAPLEIGVAGSAGLTGTGCPQVKLMFDRSVLVVSGNSGSEKISMTEPERMIIHTIGNISFMNDNPLHIRQTHLTCQTKAFYLSLLNVRPPSSSSSYFSPSFRSQP